MKVRQSLFLTFSQLLSSVVVELAGLVILARLLTPAEMGLFATGLAVFSFLQFLCNFGLYEYLIQADTISRSMRKSVLGLSLSISVACACALWAGAALAPEAWLERDLRGVIAILAACVAMRPFTGLPTALLHRAMRFGAMYVLKMTAALSFASVSVLLAWLDFGAASLAWGLLASSSAFSIVAAVFTRFAFVVVPSADGWSAIGGYSRTVAATGGLQQVSDSSITILLGQLMGYGALGLYNRAEDIIKKFDHIVGEAVAPVMLSFLAHQAREGASVKASYLTKTAHLSAICWPVGGFLILFADPFVSLLLGGQWRGVIPLVRVLAINILLMPFCATIWSFIVALRLQRRYLPIALSVNSFRVAAVVGFAFVSLPTVCIGLVAATAMNVVLIHRMVKPVLELRWRDMADAVRASGIATLLALVPAAALSFYVSGELPHDVVVALGAGVLMAPFWLLGIWRADHLMKQEILGALNVVRRVGQATP